MTQEPTLSLNSDCYCCPIDRGTIIDAIVAQNAVPNMAALLANRLHYFANTSVFLSRPIIQAMSEQIQAIEDIIKLPAYRKAVKTRTAQSLGSRLPIKTQGVFMGYDFHITDDGPRLIEINSNAGGASIVYMVGKSCKTPQGDYSNQILNMFKAEWTLADHTSPLRTIAIVDSNPKEQYHYPDMCLTQNLLERAGLNVIITDPQNLRITNGALYHTNGALYHQDTKIDLVYNRLTDFDLSEQSNFVIKRALEDRLAVITPAPDHHALYADKRNLILFSDQQQLATFGASAAQMKTLEAVPKTLNVTPKNAEVMWENRRKLFFKPHAGYGSRGAFRGAKLTKKVWASILKNNYIAQDLIPPPLRAVTVNNEKITLKFDVRVYTYAGQALLLAARVYQGQTTNLRTAGGGLAPVIPMDMSTAACRQ